MSRPRNKVLLVDDDCDLLRLLSLRLSAAGYETIPAESGEEALARLEMEPFQVVITDMRMAGMDGLALFDTIHRCNPALPVIILTAHGTIPDAVAATRRGVFAFLTKPFDGKELIEHLERAIRLSRTDLKSDPSVQDEDWREEIITRSPRMEALLGEAKLVAETDVSVLIRGESGTGKELLARAVHRASRRRTEPFVAFNCAAIPETLLESELFGYAKGAFTGAARSYHGLFQAAHGGTLFLDEIGDMPQALQAKLLRVLQERHVRPLGSTRVVPIDVRVISATHRNLEDELASGRFRADLYYRLNVVSLEIPALEMHREDIPLLVRHRLRQLSNKTHKNVRGLAPEALELLISAPWPGNVRQLLNVVEHVFALCTTPLVPAALVSRALQEQPGRFPSFDEARTGFEQAYLVRLLKITNGNVAQAARLAKRNRTDFYKLMRRNLVNPSLFKGAPDQDTKKEL